MSRIGLFFGSFNPIHNGHIDIAQFVLGKGLVDEIWLVVSPLNPHKRSTELIPVEHRLNMARMAVEDVVGVSVSEVELNLPVPSYTVQTLEKLRAENPKDEFVVLMGGDNLSSFSTWKRHDDILKNHNILCYSRPGSEGANLSDHPKVKVLDGPLLNDSSTEIRNDLMSGRSVTGKIPGPVIQYISDHSLFG